MAALVAAIHAAPPAMIRIAKGSCFVSEVYPEGAVFSWVALFGSRLWLRMGTPAGAPIVGWSMKDPVHLGPAGVAV